MERENATDSTEEIEITPEMIDAGRDVVEEYYFGDGQYALTDECLSKAYRRMRSIEKRLAHVIVRT